MKIEPIVLKISPEELSDKFQFSVTFLRKPEQKQKKKLNHPRSINKTYVRFTIQIHPSGTLV